jgi:multidrug efflux system outer membrane protein
MKIQKYIFFGILVSTSSCKLFQEIPDKQLLVPTQLTTTDEKIAFDTLIKKDAIALENRASFFKDSLLRMYIDTALQRNFDFRLAWEKIKQQEAHVARMKGVLLPQLGIQLGGGMRKFGDYTIDGVGNYDTQFSQNLTENQRIPDPIVPDYSVGFTTSWEIDVWGKLRAQKKAIVYRYLSSETGRKFLQTKLISDLADNYFRLLVLDEQKKLIEENIRLQENALQISIAQKQTGNGNQLAIDILEAKILAAKNELLTLQKLILEEENAFNLLLGNYPQVVERTSWKSQVDNSLNTGISSESLLKRPDIQATFLELKASESELTAAKKAFYPSFIIKGSIGLNAFRALLLADAPSSFAFQMLGGIAAPLVNRRELKAELLENQSKKREQYVKLEQTITNA